jgi:hypothetical protein
MPDFLPRREDELLAWLRNFDEQINFDPQAFGVSPERAAKLHARFETYEAAYRLATAPATRTGSAIVLKDTAKAAVLEATRQIANSVRAQPQVGDDARFLLGIRLKRVGRKSPIPPPERAPSIRVLSRLGWSVIVRLFDIDAQHRTAKPKGVSGAVLLSYAGEQPPTDLGLWSLRGHTSTTVTTLHFPGDLPRHARVWITARWINPTGQHGPAATPTWAEIAGDTAFAA